MTQVWNGDWAPNNKSQYGDVEYGGTMDGTPPLGDRLKIAQIIDGIKGRDGNPFAKVITASGDQYGQSSGERTLLRQFPGSAIVSRGPGYDSYFCMSALFPDEFPYGSSFDGWAIWEWHGGSPYPSFTNLRPTANSLIAECNNNPSGSVQRTAHTVIANLDDRTNSWHDLIVRVKHHPTEGVMQVWHRQADEEDEMDDTPVVNLLNRPTIFSNTKNYLLIGFYGPARSYTRWLMHDAAREFTTLDEAMAYMNSLPKLGTTTPPPTEPTDPCKVYKDELAVVQNQVISLNGQLATANALATSLNAQLASANENLEECEAARLAVEMDLAKLQFEYDDNMKNAHDLRRLLRPEIMAMRAEGMSWKKIHNTTLGKAWKEVMELVAPASHEAE